VLTLATLLAACLSAAPTAPEAGTTADVPTERVDGPRLRFGAGPWGGFGVMVGGEGGAGFSAHVGDQLNHDWAIFGIVQGGTAVILYLATVSVMVDRTFFDHLSVGVGGGLVANALHCGFGGGKCAAAAGEYLGVNIPLRLAYNFGETATTYARRHRFYVALDGGLGVMLGGSHGPSTSLTPGAYVGFGLGYTAM
jgi:hypothetical protein